MKDSDNQILELIPDILWLDTDFISELRSIFTENETN